MPEGRRLVHHAAGPATRELLPCGRPSGDQVIAIFLAVPISVVLGVLAAALLVVQGRPVFYGSERLGRNGIPFTLWKLRTMHPSGTKERVLGGEHAGRVTPMGRFLRRSRLDELPQVYNVLRGEIRFIGPRPPLERYARILPDKHIVLEGVPPGITGLATAQLCRREERILGGAIPEAVVDDLYLRRCLPAKARMDRLYRDRASPGLMLYVLLMTVWRNPSAGRRLRRACRAIPRAWRA